MVSREAEAPKSVRGRPQQVSDDLGGLRAAVHIVTQHHDPIVAPECGSVRCDPAFHSEQLGQAAVHVADGIYCRWPMLEGQPGSGHPSPSPYHAVAFRNVTPAGKKVKTGSTRLTTRWPRHRAAVCRLGEALSSPGSAPSLATGGGCDRWRRPQGGGEARLSVLPALPRRTV